MYVHGFSEKRDAGSSSAGLMPGSTTQAISPEQWKQVSELKVALRVAMGVDFLDTGVQDLMDLADTDGTGKLSFDEFKAVCKQAV